MYLENPKTAKGDMHIDTAGDEETRVSHQGDHSLPLYVLNASTHYTFPQATIKLGRNHHTLLA